MTVILIVVALACIACAFIVGLQMGVRKGVAEGVQKGFAHAGEAIRGQVLAGKFYFEEYDAEGKITRTGRPLATLRKPSRTR